MLLLLLLLILMQKLPYHFCEWRGTLFFKKSVLCVQTLLSLLRFVSHLLFPHTRLLYVMYAHYTHILCTMNRQTYAFTNASLHIM